MRVVLPPFLFVCSFICFYFFKMDEHVRARAFVCYIGGGGGSETQYRQIMKEYMVEQKRAELGLAWESRGDVCCE